MLGSSIGSHFFVFVLCVSYYLHREKREKERGGNERARENVKKTVVFHLFVTVTISMCMCECRFFITLKFKFFDEKKNSARSLSFICMLAITVIKKVKINLIVITIISYW